MEYPNPAGGCLLTDRGFSNRLKELLEKNNNSEKRDLQLLSVGRHFRLTDTAKLILGRDKSENEELETFLTEADYLITALDIPGPWCLIVGQVKGDEPIKKAAQICAAYSDTEEKEQCSVIVEYKGQKKEVLVIVNKNDRTELRIN